MSAAVPTHSSPHPLHCLLRSQRHHCLLSRQVLDDCCAWAARLKPAQQFAGHVGGQPCAASTMGMHCLVHDLLQHVVEAVMQPPRNVSKFVKVAEPFQPAKKKV